jgi:hypothetical protein
MFRVSRRLATSIALLAVLTLLTVISQPSQPVAAAPSAPLDCPPVAHTDWWPGGIDDVRVFSGVLSNPQIAYLATL